MKVLGYESYIQVYPQCPKEVPNSMLSERHAAVVYGRSLKAIDDWGGMTPAEIVLNIEQEYDRRKLKSDADAVDILTLEVSKYERMQNMREG